MIPIILTASPKEGDVLHGVVLLPIKSVLCRFTDYGLETQPQANRSRGRFVCSGHVGEINKK